MKKLNFLIAFFFGMSALYAQTSLTVGAPANTNNTTTLRAPNGTTAHTTLRGHIIISAAEMAGIPSGTVISGLGFLYSAGVNVPAGGTIKYYLENTTDATNLKSTTWATAISTMTSVYNGPYSIPMAAGASNSTLTSTFTYTGGGLYVAYDYLGTTFATTAAAYLCNTTIAGGVKVDVSATTTPPAVLTLSSGFRPEIRFTFPNPFTNNIRVDGVFAGKGKDNLLLGTTQSVTAQITNISSGSLTNVPVSLAITGANPHTATQTVLTLAPGASATVNFLAVPKTNTGVQTVVVSVPPDQQPSNDTWTLTQNVYCDTVGYSYGNAITSGLGYNTGTGILANLLVLPPGSPKIVKKVVPTIATATTSVGNSIKGVLLNSAGVIIDSTASHTITAANLGQKVELTFLGGNVNHAGDSVYYGFRQNANGSIGYFPMATQESTGIVPVDLFCGFDAFGGGYANYTGFGVFMIGAVLSPLDITTTAAAAGICPGSSLTVTANTGLSSYNFVIDGTSVQNGALTTYSYTPSANTVAKVISSVGSCSFSDSATVLQILPVTSSPAVGLCAGSTYNFNGQILNSPGTYVDTLPASTGCDSIITLTITTISEITNAISASICTGSTYTFGSQTLNTSGIYSDTLTSSSSCDSIVTLTLAVNSETYASIGANLCTGTTYTFGGQVLNSPGTYTDTIQNAGGCDSIITLTLVGASPSSGSLSANICPGGSYFFGGIPLTSAGTYTNTVMNAAGCDSVITLTLSVLPAPTVTVSASGSTLTATSTPAGCTYQWVTCPAFTPLVGKTSATFNPSAVIGEYAVVATSPQGCSVTSTCTIINKTGIDELDLSASIILYPNPTVGTVNIVSEAGLISKYIVYDLYGRVVASSDLENGLNSFSFSVEKFESGSYSIELITEKGSILKSFVKR